MNEQTTPEELAAILKREFEAADDYHDQIEPLQDAAFRYYEAQPFGNEIEGRSQIVLPDVQETVDTAVGALLKTLISGGRTVEFESTDEEAEQAADDATAALDYNFMRRQDGLRVLHDVATDGLLKMYGVFKATCEEEERVSRERVTIDPLMLGMLPEGVELDEEPVENEDGSVTVTLKTQRVIKSYPIVAVPTNEFRFSKNAKHEDTAEYLSHSRAVTRSELVEMGFDPDQVYNLPAYGRDLNDNGVISKLDNSFHDTEHSTPALEEVLLHEEYARIDVDGDGIAERVKCYRVENEILLDAESGEPSIETVDEQPFSVFCPFPRPHRLVGYSLAHKVMDAQLARSFVARQLFDGMHLSNHPRHQIDMSLAADETLDDYLSPIPGPIRTRGAALTTLSNNFDPGKSLAVMEWISREKEGRSGVGRATATLDENALNPQTATEFAGRQSQGETLQELMARNLAEALGRAFMKSYRVMRAEAEPFSIRVDGAYREVDPSQWPEDVNMKVTVGLGNAARDKQVQGLMALAQFVQPAIDVGFAGHEHGFNLIDKLARSLDVGQGGDFMFDPTDPEVQQRKAQEAEQPDPEVQAKQAEIEAQQQQKATEMQLRAAEAEQKLSLMEQDQRFKLEMEERKQQREMALAEYKANREFELAQMKMAMEAETRANMTDQRMGGSVAS